MKITAPKRIYIYIWVSNIQKLSGDIQYCRIICKDLPNILRYIIQSPKPFITKIIFTNILPNFPKVILPNIENPFFTVIFYHSNK